MILVQMFVLGVIIMSATRIKNSLLNLSGNKVFGILFWGLMLTTLLMYIIEGTLNGYAYRFFSHYPRKCALKKAVDWIPIAIGIIVGTIPSSWLCIFTPSPVVLDEQHRKLCYRNIKLCNVGYFIALETFFVLIMYVTVRIVPTFLIAVVFPMEVVTIVVMVIVELVCGPLLFIPFSILLSSIVTCNFSNCKEKARLLIFGLVSISVSISVRIMDNMYIGVLHYGTNSGGLLQVLLSLFTTFLIGIFSYIMKRIFLGKKSITVLLMEGSKNGAEDSGTHRDYGSNHTSNVDPELQHLVTTHGES